MLEEKGLFRNWTENEIEPETSFVFEAGAARKKIG